MPASDTESLETEGKRWALHARYVVAITAVALATATRIALNPWLPAKVTLVTFYPAVMIAAWYGGLWPGLVSTLLSTLVAAYLWLPPIASTTINDRDDLFALAAFVMVGIVISGLNESLHRVNERQNVARKAVERAWKGEASAKRDAEAANRLKDQFLAVVSHEVRTPVNSILGWSQMLLNGALSEPSARQRALTAIHENARRQHALIEDLLDVARIGSGTLRLERTMVDMVDVVRGAVDVVEPAAVAKRIVITAELTAERVPVMGDVVRLHQIVGNLLVNAVKFTADEGEVSVRVWLEHDSAHLQVRDSGPGIPADFLPFVFEPFRQAADSSRPGAGLGLGMAIVKQLVVAHGGSISADGGGNGRGATFTVCLPLAHAAVREDLPEQLEPA